MAQKMSLFNYYHSSLHMTIEYSFGMLVYWWGCLRKLIPEYVSIKRTAQLTRTLCIFHNFCINNNYNIEQYLAANAILITLLSDDPNWATWRLNCINIETILGKHITITYPVLHLVIFCCILFNIYRDINKCSYKVRKVKLLFLLTIYYCYYQHL